MAAEIYMSPLSKEKDITKPNGEVVPSYNLWASASIIANVGVGRIVSSATPKTREACKEAVVAQYPDVDCEDLLNRAAHENEAIAMIVNAVHNRLNQAAETVFDGDLNQ